jgi:hypothetical protein
MDTEHDFHTFMRQLSSYFASEYERIRRRSTEDPGTAGDQGENNWKALFEKVVPKHYHVATKGRIINQLGQTSGQVDVVILKPSYPPGLIDNKMWLSGGVVAAFECKNTLKASHISKAIALASELKSLYKVEEGSPASELISPIYVGLLAHSHNWKSTKSKPIETIRKYISASMKDLTNPRYMLDCICVADLGTWSHIICSRFDWNVIPDKEKYEELCRLTGYNWAIASVMACYSKPDAHFSEPVGSLIQHLFLRLARYDVNIQDIAKYYNQLNLSYMGSGDRKFFHPNCYSDKVRKMIDDSTKPNSDSMWGGWNTFF